MLCRLAGLRHACKPNCPCSWASPSVSSENWCISIQANRKQRARAQHQWLAGHRCAHWNTCFLGTPAETDFRNGRILQHTMRSSGYWAYSQPCTLVPNVSAIHSRLIRRLINSTCELTINSCISRGMWQVSYLFNTCKQFFCVKDWKETPQLQYSK